MRPAPPSTHGRDFSQAFRWGRQRAEPASIGLRRTVALLCRLVILLLLVGTIALALARRGIIAAPIGRRHRIGLAAIGLAAIGLASAIGLAAIRLGILI